MGPFEPEEHQSNIDNKARAAFGGLVVLASADLVATTYEVTIGNHKTAGLILGLGAVSLGGLGIAVDRWYQRKQN